MKMFRDCVLVVGLMVIVGVLPCGAQTSAPPTHDRTAHYDKFQDMKWKKLVPAEGAGSPEITMLHVDPVTGATQLMIRTPKNYHAPRHWHTANETHLVVSGTFIMRHEGGEREVLGPGSYNYMPAKMIHEAWTKPDEGSMEFITVDGPWDLNLVDGPNKKLPPPD